MSCERFVEGEINCGACKHSWWEWTGDDADEGCELGHSETYFEAEPGTDCPDWTPKEQPQPSDGEVAVPEKYLEALESAANRFCSSCRDNNASCSMTARHFGGTGCGAWKLDGARINALRSNGGEA